MEIYSIGLAIDCPLDDEFFELIERTAHSRGLTTYKVLPYNLEETLLRFQNNQIRFRSFYVCGRIITTWWNDYWHRYEPFSERDLEKIDVNQIDMMMNKIH